MTDWLNGQGDVEPQFDENSGPILRQQMATVFPELANVRIDYCWSGRVDITANRLVPAGERDGVYCSMGYSGHGTHMATLMAEIINGPAEFSRGKRLQLAFSSHFGK